MSWRNALVASVLVLLAGTAGWAQQQTGEVFGRVVDRSGAVLPGVTVTVAGPSLLQPRVVTTSETGSYIVPELPVGTYSVTFELAGFRTLQRTDIRITIGFRAPVNAEMEISTIQETVTVTGESPLIDTRETGTKASFDLETLQNIPSARDPWVMLERTPGIAMDRVNVGGTQSGQQSNYVSRGSGTGNNKWSIDGVDITDMAAIGASPMYYDFDMLEEMQVTTGGADASQQTSGVGINFVTRSGTDRLKGSGRFYVTDDDFQSVNVTDEVRRAGSGSGAPIQNIKDYGFEVGGPIAKGKLWYWGSYGKQDIKAGIVGFYLPSAECQQMKATLAADPLALAARDVWKCLGTDGTKLNNYNWKVNWAPASGNRFSFQNTWAEKFKNARDASDTRPPETTFVQSAVPKSYGTYGWLTGPTPLWKAGDQHIINDRWLVDALWSHVGNNFILDFQEPGLNAVQPRQEITTGVWGRSYLRSGPFLRPTNSVDITTNYFLPAVLGGDHAFKAGYRWRSANAYSESHYGGNTVARYRSGVAAEADLWRDSATDYHLDTQALFAQDAYTVGRATLNLGVRIDRQRDVSRSSSVAAHPFAPQWLPAVTFGGADPGITWTDVSPRLGLTYHITPDGTTIGRASYAAYYGQLNTGGLSGILNPVTAASIRFPWADANGDGFVQPSELDYTRILSFSGNYNPDNPGFIGTQNTIDRAIKNDRTREFIAGVSRELGSGMAVDANYIFRRYDRFRWDYRLGVTSADYVARQFAPAGCPAGADCPTVTYYEPTFPLPGVFQRQNRPDTYRDYNGLELVLRRRLQNRWMGSLSVAYNNAVDNWSSSDAYQDPTCVSTQCAPSQQFAPESGGSGIDNIFTNAKWLVKGMGAYTLPWWDIGVSGFVNARQGYPFPQAVLTPSRANRAGTALVLLRPVGETRLPSLYTADLRFDRSVAMGRAKIVPTLDIFNLGNVNTVLARRRTQNASNANRISGIVAPRVIRFGVRVSW